MKKILFGMMAALTLAASCQNDFDYVPTGEETAQVTFNVGAPEMATRAFSDGATATVLQYAVYDAAGNELTDLTVTDAEIHGSTTVNLQLTTGNTYSVIFWAAAENAPYTVDFDAKTMTVDYTNAVSNDEERDAFYAYHEFTVTGSQTETVYLKRPFAQLNIGTSDYTVAEAAGYAPEYSYVKVPVSAELNLVDGSVDAAAEVEFKLAAIPANEEFPVAGYDYLSMNYLLVAAEKEVVDIEFGYSENNTTVEKSRIVGSVPVQRNHRTNIYGQLLTSDVDVNVEIKPGYDDPKYDNEYLYYISEGVYHITSAEGLKYFAEQVNAGNSEWKSAKVALDEDIDLSSLTRAANEWTPIGNTSTNYFSGTFDGQGHTVSNYQITSQEGYAGLFGYARATIKNLTVKDVTIVAKHYAGGIVGQGYMRIENCHAENVDITLSCKQLEDGTYDWGDKAGAIIGQNCEGGLYVKNCSANNVAIKGYRDLGGIIGMASDGNTVSGCLVNNISVIQDLTNGYETEAEKYATIGGVIGRLGNDRKGTNLINENNTIGENVVVATEITNNDDLHNALKGGLTSLVLAAGEYDLSNATFAANKVTIVGSDKENCVVTNKKQLRADGKSLTLQNLTVNVPVGLNYDEFNFGWIHYFSEFNMINCNSNGRIRLNSHKATIDGCTFNVTTSSGFDGYALHHQGAPNSTVVVKNSTFNTAGKAIVMYNEGQPVLNLDVENCTFTSSNASTDKAAIQIHSEWGISGTLDIVNCTATGFADVNGGLWNEVDNNYKTPNNNFNVTVNGNLAQVAGFGPVTEGYYAIDNTYVVLTAEGFKNVATTILADGTKNVTVELAANINLAGIEWPAVRANAAFVLDGKGFAIENLTTSAVESNGFDCTAMFSSTRKATTIKNLVVRNATITGNGQENSHGAVFVATNWGELTFSNVKVEASTVSNCDRSSILATYLYFTNAKAEECVVEGCTINSIGTAGAILGVNNGHDFEMVNCEVNNTTISSSEGNNKAGIFIGTWQQAGTLTESGNTRSNSKAINAGEETNNNIGRLA